MSLKYSISFNSLEKILVFKLYIGFFKASLTDAFLSVDTVI